MKPPTSRERPRSGRPWLLCSAVLAAVLVFVPSTPTTSFVAETTPDIPSATEIRMLEELAAWVVGMPVGQQERYTLFDEAEIEDAIRQSSRGFELFRRYSTEDERRRLLDGLPFGDVISRVASEYRIDGLLLAAVVEAESSFDPDVISPRGAVGLMQLMPETAAGYGFETLQEPGVNVRAGARYLRALIERYDGDLALALAAYNAGPGAVDRFGGVPPYRETDRYVKKVLSTYVGHHRSLWLEGDLAPLLSG